MEKLKVKFVDFWVNLNEIENHYFYKALAKYYELEVCDQPNVVFYSCFGHEHLKYKCTRIFFSCENWRPNFKDCDYAITFDYIDEVRHLRFPLWTLYYDSSIANFNILNRSAEELLQSWRNKPKFCCIVVSNPQAKERIDFYHTLNKYKEVDSAGRWNNTIGYDLPAGTQNKLEFIKDYRFVISFENGSHSGYTTEKVLEPLLAGCIPIYWGDPDVEKDFNTERIIQIKHTDEFEAAVKKILYLEENPEAAIAFFKGPITAETQGVQYLNIDYLSEKLFTWIEEAKKEFSRTRLNLSSNEKILSSPGEGILIKNQSKAVTTNLPTVISKKIIIK